MQQAQPSRTLALMGGLLPSLLSCSQPLGHTCEIPSTVSDSLGYFVSKMSSFAHIQALWEYTLHYS